MVTGYILVIRKFMYTPIFCEQSIRWELRSSILFYLILPPEWPTKIIVLAINIGNRWWRCLQTLWMVNQLVILLSASARPGWLVHSAMKVGFLICAYALATHNSVWKWHSQLFNCYVHFVQVQMYVCIRFHVGLHKPTKLWACTTRLTH